MRFAYLTLAREGSLTAVPAKTNIYFRGLQLREKRRSSQGLPTSSEIITFKLGQKNDINCLVSSQFLIIIKIIII